MFFYHICNFSINVRSFFKVKSAINSRMEQPTPVFLPGESQGPGSLVGFHLWGRTKLDMTEAT